VTGTTGIAACNVGGVTVHSFAGCGLGDEPVGEMVAKMERSSFAKKRWKQCRTLVIDEVG
jgi:ATP-dependent DNA helicase PIF1